MFIVDGAKVICADCQTIAIRYRDWEAEKHKEDPEWFWEPYYEWENYFWICPKCRAKDFISD